MKLVAAVVAVLCVLVMGMCGEALAQGALPRIGVVKWAIPADSMQSSGRIAYAKRAERLFVGTNNGIIVVVDTKKGVPTDTIDLFTYKEVNSGYVRGTGKTVEQLAVSDDGKLIAAGIQNHLRLILISYPEKDLLDSAEMNVSNYCNLPGYGLFLSQHGRFLVNQDAIIDRTSGYIRKIPYGQFHACFDSAESTVAYNYPYITKGNDKDIYYSDYVATWDLRDTATVPFYTGLFGYPTLSADGTKLMTSGRTCRTDNATCTYGYAVVMDLTDRTLLWQIKGDASPDPGDFDMFAWSENGDTYFGIHRSVNLPMNQQHHLFGYKVGATKPYSILNDGHISGGPYFPIINTSMTEAYVDAIGYIYAIDLTQTATSVVSPEGHVDADTIYPNPTKGTVTVKCSDTHEVDSWELHSLDGRVIRGDNEYVSHMVGETSDQYSIRLPNELSPGMYVLHLYSSGRELVCHYTVVKQ